MRFNMHPRVWLSTAALFAAAGATPVGATQLFFVDIFVPDTTTGSVRTIMNDGSQLDTIADTGGGLRAVAVDPVDQKVYWSDVDNFVIYRSNLDGSNQEPIITTSVGFASAIAIDEVNRKIYWGDQFEKQSAIWRANLDGSEIDFVTSTAFHRGIAVDPANGKLYWTTSQNMFKGQILQADLDGSNVGILVESPLELEFKPSTIAIDVAGGKIYWNDYVVDVIRRANLSDGSNIQTLYTVGGNFNPRGVALDLNAGKLYWGQDIDFVGSAGKIMWMNLDGSNPQDFLTDTGLVNYIALYEPQEECLGDVAPKGGNGQVDIDDLFGLIGAWGTADPLFDLNASGLVDIDDLFLILGVWGPC